MHRYNQFRFRNTDRELVLGLIGQIVIYGREIVEINGLTAVTEAHHKKQTHAAARSVDILGVDHKLMYRIALFSFVCPIAKRTGVGGKEIVSAKHHADIFMLTCQIGPQGISRVGILPIHVVHIVVGNNNDVVIGVGGNYLIGPSHGFSLRVKFQRHNHKGNVLRFEAKIGVVRFALGHSATVRTKATKSRQGEILIKHGGITRGAVGIVVVAVSYRIINAGILQFFEGCGGSLEFGFVFGMTVPCYVPHVNGELQVFFFFVVNQPLHNGVELVGIPSSQLLNIGNNRNGKITGSGGVVIHPISPILAVANVHFQIVQHHRSINQLQLQGNGGGSFGVKAFFLLHFRRYYLIGGGVISVKTANVQRSGSHPTLGIGQYQCGRGNPCGILGEQGKFNRRAIGVNNGQVIRRGGNFCLTVALDCQCLILQGQLGIGAAEIQERILIAEIFFYRNHRTFYNFNAVKRHNGIGGKEHIKPHIVDAGQIQGSVGIGTICKVQIYHVPTVFQFQLRGFPVQLVGIGLFAAG